MIVFPKYGWVSFRKNDMGWFWKNGLDPSNKIICDLVMWKILNRKIDTLLWEKVIEQKKFVLLKVKK